MMESLTQSIFKDALYNNKNLQMHLFNHMQAFIWYILIIAGDYSTFWKFSFLVGLSKRWVERKVTATDLGIVILECVFYTHTSISLLHL